MLSATQRIYSELTENGNVKAFTDENDKSSEVWLQVGIENGGNYRIRFINTDDGNDTSVRIFSLLTLTEDQVAKILPVLNNLNNDYRFLCFTCDDDGDVNISCDYLLKSGDPSTSAIELVLRITKIIDDVYPELMHALLACSKIGVAKVH